LRMVTRSGSQTSTAKVEVAVAEPRLRRGGSVAKVVRNAHRRSRRLVHDLPEHPSDAQLHCAIDATALGTAYTDLEREADGRAVVGLAGPDDGIAVTVWLDEAYPYVMLFTGDSLPDPARRRRSLGVEPMTGAPDAFRSGEGLLVLEPGQSFTGSWA
jgi:galactose mutarotase-like enzyme